MKSISGYSIEDIEWDTFDLEEEGKQIPWLPKEIHVPYKEIGDYDDSFQNKLDKYIYDLWDFHVLNYNVKTIYA